MVELLIARIEYVEGPPERIKLFCDIATVYEEQMNDRDSAFVTLQAAFREDYSNDYVAKELERLATATTLDKRISYGCINVPVKFYENVVHPAFTGTNGIVYVLPETRSTREVFASYYDVE